MTFLARYGPALPRPSVSIRALRCKSFSIKDLQDTFEVVEPGMSVAQTLGDAPHSSSGADDPACLSANSDEGAAGVSELRFRAPSLRPFGDKIFHRILADREEALWMC